MKVAIKDIAVDMSLGNKGTHFGVADNKGNHLGNFYVTKSGVTWCNGRTERKNGTTLKWTQFIKLMGDGTELKRPPRSNAA